MKKEKKSDKRMRLLLSRIVHCQEQIILGKRKSYRKRTGYFEDQLIGAWERVEKTTKDLNIDNLPPLK